MVLLVAAGLYAQPLTVITPVLPRFPISESQSKQAFVTLIPGLMCPRSGRSPFWIMDKRILDNHLASVMTRTGRRVNNRLTARLRRVGLSLDAWLVLNLLVTEGGRSMGGIADSLVLNLPTATKLIDRMVNDNLVYRRPHHEDRRVVEIFLSDAGKLRHEVARKLVAEEQADLKKLSPRVDQLMKQLIRLNRQLGEKKQ